MSAHFSAASDSLVGVMFPDFVSLSHAEVSVSTTPLAALLVRTDERDQFFGDVYPESKAAADYIAFTKQLPNGAVESALEQGIRDGSLHLSHPSWFMGRFLINTLLALAQRILPRAAHYQQEQGYSLEYLFLLPQVLIDGISEK